MARGAPSHLKRWRCDVCQVCEGGEHSWAHWEDPLRLEEAAGPFGRCGATVEKVACHIFGISATSFKISWLPRDRSAPPRGAPSRLARGRYPYSSAVPIASTSATKPVQSGIPSGGRSYCPRHHGDGGAPPPTLQTAAARRRMPRGGGRGATAAARRHQNRPPRVRKQRWRRRRRVRAIPPLTVRATAGRSLAAGAPARGRIA